MHVFKGLITVGLFYLRRSVSRLWGKHFYFGNVVSFSLGQHYYCHYCEKIKHLKRLILEEMRGKIRGERRALEIQKRGR
jgi:hypothetical protein